MRLWEQGTESSRAESIQYFQRAARVTEEMERRLMQLLKANGISFVVAPYEGRWPHATLTPRGAAAGWLR